MSLRELQALAANANKPSSDLRDYATGDGQKQYTLDLIATITLMMAGFVTHPRYNEFIREDDPQEFINTVRDEFRQLNTYIVEHNIQRKLLLTNERYSYHQLKAMVAQVGTDYAEYVLRNKRLPEWDEGKAIVDSCVKRFFPKLPQ